MISLDHPPGVVEDRRFVLDTAIRRQSTPGLAQRHRAARGVEPHADLPRRRDLVVEPTVVWKEVRVIEDRRAAGRGELGQADEGAPARGLGSPAGPNLVVGPQPGEQVDVLASRERAGQRLVEVVVGVHEAGQHDLARHVQHDVGVLRKLLGGAYLLDYPIPDEQPSIGEFTASIVHSDQDVGVARQKRWHSQVLLTDSKSSHQTR
jgi:hypothetical protein